MIYGNQSSKSYWCLMSDLFCKSIVAVLIRSLLAATAEISRFKIKIYLQHRFDRGNSGVSSLACLEKDKNLDIHGIWRKEVFGLLLTLSIVYSKYFVIICFIGKIIVQKSSILLCMFHEPRSRFYLSVSLFTISEFAWIGKFNCENVEKCWHRNQHQQRHIVDHQWIYSIRQYHPVSHWNVGNKIHLISSNVYSKMGFDSTTYRWLLHFSFQWSRSWTKTSFFGLVWLKNVQRSRS